MKIALVNPNWHFDGSVYFGCRAPHLPLELGLAQRMLEDAGHKVCLIDGHLFELDLADIAAEVRGFRPDMTVLTTAPTYLFWRARSLNCGCRRRWRRRCASSPRSWWQSDRMDRRRRVRR